MKGYLHLATGDVFEGNWLVSPPNGAVTGEIAFYTGMTGYQEVLTDPGNKDQIIVFTYPLIGNCGINEKDIENKKPQVAAVIVYEGNQAGCHYEATCSFKEYMEKWNIPVLEHVDTRAVVKKIRSQGVMAAQLSSNKEIKYLPAKDNTIYPPQVSVERIETFGDGWPHIVLLDFGKKHSIVSSLLSRGCKVTVVPYNTPYHAIEKLCPDGVLLSNGPGDPKQWKNELANVKKIASKYPLLGIGLGHQLTALALGGNTKKLFVGHRGGNYPVKDMKNNIIFMTSQNHGYAVEEESLGGTGLIPRFYNLHDKTNEGLVHKHLPIQTVQFHPEANPGPYEGDYVFDEFLQNIKEKNRSRAIYA